ncbi:MAG: EAL domain-containing protein [Rubrivivax sp.]|nr:EAL domain-containing protein [Rubrivivax sp.]
MNRPSRPGVLLRLRAAWRAASAAWEGITAAPAPRPAPVPAAAGARRQRADRVDRGERSSSEGARQLLHLFAHSETGLMTCRRDGRILLVSPVAARTLGVDAAALRDTPITDWLAPLAADAGSEAFGAGHWETTARRADGSTFPVELTVSQTELDGRPQYVVMFRDITDRRVTQERLQYLANYDSLTGLPNRTLFRDRLGHAMARARRSGQPMALMFLDLDHFKVINDSLGHEVGDQLLRHVAETLRNCLRRVDSLARHGAPEAEDSFTVSRLGGDEFTVIAEQVGSAEDAALLARRILEALETPFHWLDNELHVAASIGISMYPADDTDLDGLIRHTDMAMYRSKAMGRGTYSFFSEELSAEVAARLSLENHLRRALERQEFLLHYQPKARLATGVVTGVEALIRWHPPGRGLVPPDRFIRVLEDSGLILPVGAWAIRAACAELAAWDRAGAPPLTLAVNLSARQFRQPYLARFIADTLAETGVDPRRLELELTESLLMEDTEANRSVFAALAALGVRVAIDDFGTGHSSLSYLKRFAIDTLKIDRSFVSELPQDAEDCAIATAIVAMAHSLNMKVVAEGVETVEQADYLRGLGCNEIQGYLVSRPLPAPQLLAWLEKRRGSDAMAQLEFARADSEPMTLMTMDTLGPPA